MSEMVERVARAIASRHDLDLPPDAMTYNMDNKLVPYWTLFVGDARAAIAAMREPTRAMEKAGEEAEVSHSWGNGPTTGEYIGDPETIWTAMIDAAISEELVATD